MQKRNNILNKDHQDYFININKFIFRKNISLNNKRKLPFITSIFKKDVDMTTLMTYN
jgi:hypothetical protein